MQTFVTLVALAIFIGPFLGRHYILQKFPGRFE